MSETRAITLVALVDTAPANGGKDVVYSLVDRAGRRIRCGSDTDSAIMMAYKLLAAAQSAARIANPIGIVAAKATRIEVKIAPDGMVSLGLWPGGIEYAVSPEYARELAARLAALVPDPRNPS